MNIWIDQETQKEVNIHAPYKGRSRLDTAEIRAAVGVIEYTITTKPLDYSDETYTCDSTGDGMPPYRIWTKKSDEQLAQLHNSKIESQIREFEAAQDRAIREAFVISVEAGVAMLQSIDNQIEALRQQRLPVGVTE